MSHAPNRSPVLLLKTRSTPVDSYEEYFSNEPFTPIFVPVLEHKPNVQNLNFIRSLLRDGRLGRHPPATHGGIIFTSQRAVEGFAKVVEQVEQDQSTTHRGRVDVKHNQDPDALAAPRSDSSVTAPLPLYVVGPATYRTLASVISTSFASPHSILTSLNPQIFGSQTGNGEALAHYVLKHYHTLPGPKHTLPLLFLVGEQRRDVIPKTLMDPALPKDNQIRVDELVVYETGVMESFAHDFASHISRFESDTTINVTVVVVFSPSGCEAMLRCLGYIDEGNKLTEKGKSAVKGLPDVRSRFVITTIGPTTKDYLEREFNFEADVCAETPSPEGIGEGVKNFLADRAYLGP